MSPPQQIAQKGMGLIGAAFGIGFVVGPATATLLIHDSFHNFVAGIGMVDFADWMRTNKYALPGFFAAFLSFCSFLMVWFKLEETVDTKQRENNLPFAGQVCFRQRSGDGFQFKRGRMHGVF
jgi:hypothetical protein